MEVDLAAILSTIAATVEPRRAPALLSTSLARRFAIVWCIKRLFVPSRRRRPTDWPYSRAVSLDRDDPALDTLAARMSHPSLGQWFGLLCGVLNWIVSPGFALSLGAWFLPSARIKKNVNPHTTNIRTRTFWVPALVSLTAAMAGLSISTLCSLEPRFLASGWATYVAYVPWLLSLPLCGGAGAYLSRRAGGERQACLAAGLFPVIAMTTLVGFLMVIGEFIYAKPQWLYFLIALLFGLILPGMALFLGAAPFAKAPGQTIHG